MFFSELILFYKNLPVPWSKLKKNCNPRLVYDAVSAFFFKSDTMSGLSARVHTRHTRVRFLAMPPREGKKAIRNQKQNQNLKKINNRHQNQMGILHCGMANLLKNF